MTALVTRPTLLVCLLCAAMLIGIPGLATRGGAPPLRLSLLTSNPCALPCMFGIVPGATRRNHLPETMTSASMSYLTYNSGGQTYRFRGNDRQFPLLMALSFGEEADSIVRSMQLFQTSSEPVLGTLSDFLLAGYHPTRVFTNCQNAQQLVIALDDQTLFMQVAPGKTFEPGARVLLMGAGSDAAEVERALVGFGCAIEHEWMGFALLWKYFAAES